MDGIYGITDRALLPGDRLFEAVEQALRGGLRWVQYRDKLASDDELLRSAQRLQRLCQTYNATLVINDRADIAARAGAGGVHLGQSDGAVKEARNLLGDQACVGVTCHNSIALASEAQLHAATYVAFGRFYSSATKPQAQQADLKLISEAKSLLRIPVVAIGGITLDNMGQIIQQGADCIALCHELFAADDVQRRAQTLIEHFHTLKRNR